MAARVRERAGYSPRGEKRSSGSYLYGTAAPKLEPVKREEEKRRAGAAKAARSSAQVRRNREKALALDLPYVILLTAASLCTLCLCVNYLHLQSSITGRMQRIEQKEAELEQLRSENDALEASINGSIDLNEIYRIATQELGMVYAGRDQVLMFDQSENDYVRQYEDIPEH